MTAQTPGLALLGRFLASTMGIPSAFGPSSPIPPTTTPFTKGRPEDYYTQDDEGEAYPFTVVVTGRDLSARWQTILRTYVAVGKLKLTYSPDQPELEQHGRIGLAGGGARPSRFPARRGSCPPFSLTCRCERTKVGTMARGAMQSDFRSPAFTTKAGSRPRASPRP